MLTPMEERIREAVAKKLAQEGAAGVSFSVERPVDMRHGDYTVNAALAAAKPLGKNPREVADMLATSLRADFGETVSNVEVAGPGFINITLSRDTVSAVVSEADAQGEEWGREKKGVGGRGQVVGKRVMVEYTDPNPFKEMHIGHLMSNTIGEAIARLIGNAGAEVARANYQGDVGPHVAKALWGLQKMGIEEPGTAKELGKAYSHGAHAYEESPEAKAEIDVINRAIYQGTNVELAELWRKGRDVSLAAFEEMYRVLGTKFDFYFFESETWESGMRIVEDGVERGIFEKSDGAIVYHGEKKGLHTRVYITSQGTPTYDAKDVGLAFLKEERWPSDCSIIITGNEQISHFQVLKASLEEIAPLLGAKTTHVAHGFLRLTTGKMSSREGNVISAAEFLESVIAKAGEKNADPAIAEQVGIGAVKYMILRQAPGSDIIFDPEKSLSLDGDSGPYVQYALVRARSVLSQASAVNSEQQTVNSRPEEPYELERVLIHYPEVVRRAEVALSPNILVTYLTELASAWNSFYGQERIRNGEHESYKLMLARAFVNTMQNGLKLLGIPAPEKM